MVKTISFDTLQIENVVIFKQNDQWMLRVNISLKSANEGNLGRNITVQLGEAQQQLQLRRFLKPFIQITRDAMDIQEVTNFVDPEEIVAEPEEEGVDVIVDTS